jgi:DNA-binding transcriptional ArsR family regulator
MPASTAPALSPAQAAQLFRLLGDEPRLRILQLLAGRGEMNVMASAWRCRP